MPTLRIGHGLDAHRLAPGRALVLAGVRIDGAPRGAAAHSDGDVLLHALADALLSSAGLGDIGERFAPNDPRWRGLASARIVEDALGALRAGGPLRLCNVAAVVVLDAPRLGPYRQALTVALGELLALPLDRVGVIFKTSEGLAPDHVQAAVTVLLERDECVAQGSETKTSVPSTSTG